MNDYDRMRQRHHDGMCGGDCPECYNQQRREREEENWRLAQEEYERQEALRSDLADTQSSERE